MQEIIENLVRDALLTDIGSGDITAELIPAAQISSAKVIIREAAVMCGQALVAEVYRQLGGDVALNWQVADGDELAPGQTLLELEGPSRQILTGERLALNCLQVMMSTATQTRDYVVKLAGCDTQLLDTRKTIPGWRQLQKYAVRCGGGVNHRMALYDAYLIKENHISACGSISNAITKARELHPDRKLMLEVENLAQLAEAIAMQVPHIMLDNFGLDQMQQAVEFVHGRAKLEASGNVNLETIAGIAATGVDYISVGAITKNVRAVDLSLLV